MKNIFSQQPAGLTIGDSARFLDSCVASTLTGGHRPVKSLSFQLCCYSPTNSRSWDQLFFCLGLWDLLYTGQLCRYHRFVRNSIPGYLTHIDKGYITPGPDRRSRNILVLIPRKIKLRSTYLAFYFSKQKIQKNFPCFPLIWI